MKKSSKRNSAEEINITTSSRVKSKSKSSTKPTEKDSAKKKAQKRERFIEQHEPFIEQLEANLTDEQEHLKEYLYLYKSLKRLSRKAKAQALKSGQSRDYYSYCTLISQQREVIADIRAISDLSGQVQMLLELALQPLVSQIGQTVVNSFYQQRKLLMETTKEKETKFALAKLDEITKDISQALQVYYQQAAEKVNEILVGGEEQPKKKRRK